MTDKSHIELLSDAPDLSKEIVHIIDKILDEERVTTDEALILYEDAGLGLLGSLANYIREKRHGDKTYFNRNFHIEPTNKCVFDCKFCSYSRSFQQQEDAWELSEEQMLAMVRKYDGIPIT